MKCVCRIIRWLLCRCCCFCLCFFSCCCFKFVPANRFCGEGHINNHILSLTFFSVLFFVPIDLCLVYCTIDYMRWQMHWKYHMNTNCQAFEKSRWHFWERLSKLSAFYSDILIEWIYVDVTTKMHVTHFSLFFAMHIDWFICRI